MDTQGHVGRGSCQGADSENVLAAGRSTEIGQFNREGMGVIVVPSAPQRLLGRRQLAPVIGAREQVAVAVEGDLDRGVTQASLH